MPGRWLDEPAGGGDDATVADALARIRVGEVSKVVLARDLVGALPDAADLLTRFTTDVDELAHRPLRVVLPAVVAAATVLVTVVAATAILPPAGGVLVIGEPSVATIGGREVLFFVYGLQLADGSINLRVGSVRKGA